MDKEIERIIEGTVLTLEVDGSSKEGVVNAAYGEGRFLIELNDDSDDGDSYDLNDMEFEILDGAEDPEAGEESSDEEQFDESAKKKKKRRGRKDEDFVVEEEDEDDSSDEEMLEDDRKLKEILMRKGKGKSAAYLCQWKGIKNPTWEDRDEMKLLGLKAKMKSFDADYVEKKKKKKRKEDAPTRKTRSGRNVKKIDYSEKAMRDAAEEQSSEEEESEGEEESAGESDVEEESEKEEEEEDKEEEEEEE